MKRWRSLQLCAIGWLLASSGCGGTLSSDRSRDAGKEPDAAPDAGVDAEVICTPGASEPCYTGLPATTEGVGLCRGGTHACNAAGTGFDACTGEITPQAEDCNTPQDEDCDGHTTCAVPLWSKSFSSSLASGTVQGDDVATDPAGDIVVVGKFHGNVDFGTGPLDAGAGWGFFVAKFDGSGNALWARGFPVDFPAKYPSLGRVASDAEGNIVAGDQFQGTVDFGTGSLDSSGAASVFLVKLDSSGSTLWSTQFAGSSWGLRGLLVDAAGEIVLANDASVRKLAPDGTAGWTTSPALAGFQGVAVDPQLNIVVSAGSTYPNNPSPIVEKFDPAGQLAWSQPLPQDPSVMQAQGVGPIASDAWGNAFVFAPYASSMTSYYGWSLYRVDASGNASRIVAGDQEPHEPLASDIATDSIGNVVFVEKSLYLDPSVFKYNAAGTAVWDRGYGADGVNGLAIDATGNIILTGSFSSQNLDFGNGPLPSSSSVSAFLAKLGP